MTSHPVDPVSAFDGIDVLVVGDAMLDTFLLGSSDRLCQEAPVPIVAVAEREHAPGGAANVAANVSALGGRPRLVALTGADADAATLRDRLEAARVDAVTVLADAQRETLVKARIVADGHLLARVDHGTTRPAAKADEAAVIGALHEGWPRCGAVAIADYGYGTLTPAVVDTIARLQRAAPRPLVVDAKDLGRYRTVGATAAKPNFEQALRLVGEPVDGDRAAFLAARAGRLLDATGANVVAVTLDHEGALAFERGRPSYRTYARPTRAATTSGAGDTFAAVLTLAFAAGTTMPEAVEFASAAAAVVVEKERTAVCSAVELRLRLSGEAKLVAGMREIATRADLHRRRGRRIVFTNGCFDLLHRGHVTYLSRAKELGDVLIVGVNADESVRNLKGPSRPINPLEDRMEVLAALSCVDVVVPFRERTPDRLIEAIRPDVFVKGGDYTMEMLPEADLVRRLGGTVRILPYVDDRSTTGLIQRIRHEAVEVP